MKGKGKKIFWFLFLLVLAGFVVVIYVIPGAESFFTKTSVVEYGEIILKTETEAYIVREETVFPNSGPGAAYFFEEGERIRKGSSIYQIGGDAKKAEETGVVSYVVDGYESLLTPETMGTISRETVESWFKEETPSAGKVKLVKEDEWYLLFWTEEEDIKNYAVSKTVTVTFPNGADVLMTVKSVQKEEESARVILSTTRYYEAMQKERKISVSVVTSDCTGLLIRNAAIGFSDNMEGVWVKQVTGDFKFVPVNVLSTDGTYSVVSEGSFSRTTTEGGSAKTATINPYDEILNTPPKAE